MKALVFIAALLACCAGFARADYQVGDHLAKPAKPSAHGAYQEIDWDALMPKDWDPIKELKATDLGMMRDGDPRANALLLKMQELWEKAPVEASLDGKRIRIPGFMVPLDEAKGKVSEFLLVPYFGACIHVPPPPANQIIHVVPDKPVAGHHMMDAVWVNGTLRTIRSQTRAGMGMASAGYRLEAQSIEPYKQK
ncbi:MAG TPA: DUF3299 domain-containing protein [Usitatibacter sp.]|nr:DUF3299 domain-containing protein [Usitatibacter sp.]